MSLSKYNTSILVSFVICLSVSVTGQNKSDSSSFDNTSVFDEFFDQVEPLSIRLEFDVRQLQRYSAEEIYLPAVLTSIEEGSHEHYNVRIKTRGTFRKSYCSLPPFWLNINRSGIPSASLKGIKKIKIVSHCMKSADYQDYVLKEYLAYKIYQLISPYSFRVRLLHVNYIDTGRKNRQSEGWAFAIEPVETMAERLDAAIIENTKLSMARMNAGIMDRLSMYYYMTGNTDFSITGMHNVKIIRLNKPGPLGNIPVPYDFDFTGFVNTSYSSPADNVPLEKVTERYYVGPCRPEETFNGIIAAYFNTSDEIHSLLQSFEYMSLEQKLDMLRFIESFFDEISQENFIRENIMKSCK